MIGCFLAQFLFLLLQQLANKEVINSQRRPRKLLICVQLPREIRLDK